MPPFLLPQSIPSSSIGGGCNENDRLLENNNNDIRKHDVSMEGMRGFEIFTVYPLDLNKTRISDEPESTGRRRRLCETSLDCASTGN